MNNRDKPAGALTIPMSENRKMQAQASGFPQEPDVYLGLTKLEAFTMAAMQGLCSRSGYGDSEGIAEDSLAVAKATLAELEKAGE